MYDALINHHLNDNYTLSCLEHQNGHKIKKERLK